jgi:hypothetical protein
VLLLEEEEEAVVVDDEEEEEEISEPIVLHKTVSFPPPPPLEGLIESEGLSPPRVEIGDDDVGVALVEFEDTFEI